MHLHSDDVVEKDIKIGARHEIDRDCMQDSFLKMNESISGKFSAGSSSKPGQGYLIGLLKYALVAFLMLVLLALGFLLKHQAFAFVDIGSDTFLQFFPLQVAEVRQLRELHDLTWSFNLGLGGYIGNEIDPFFFLSALFPDSWQLQLRLPLYLLKLLLGGGFFYGYLRLLGFGETLGILGALGYAFSGYALINGQWDPHGNELPQFAAYLFLFERYLRNGGGWAAVMAGVVAGMGDTFGIYTFALLTCVYTLARSCFVASGLRRSYFLAVVKFGALCVLGLLVMAPLQLPGLYYLFDSPRVSGDYSMLSRLLESLFALNDRTTISAEFAGLLGKDLLGTGNAYQGWTNYLEGPGFYIGLLPLLCITQLIGPAATRKERRLFMLGVGMTLAYMLFPALRYAVYGFGHIAFRFSTLWVSFALLVMGLAGLRRALLSGPWRLGLMIAAGGVLGIAFACVVQLPQSVRIEQVVRIAGFTLVYAAILFVAADSAWRVRLRFPLVAVFVCELLLFALPAMYDRYVASSNGASVVGHYDDGTEQALALVQAQEQNGEFYRVEKTYNSVFLCDALVQDYSGVKSYFFHGSSVTRFVDHVGLARPVPSISYIGSAVDRPDILDLLGVKYVLTRNRSLEKDEGMTYVGTAAGVDVYRNDTAHGFGYFYDNLATEAEADALSIDQRDLFLHSVIVVSDPSAIKARLSGMDGANAVQPALAQHALLRKIRDNRIEGEVQTPQAKTLLFSMPFDRGWSAQLDSKPLELLRADYGLTVALVPAGVHALILSYEPPGRIIGWWLCFGSLSLLAVFYLLERTIVTRPAPKRMLNSIEIYRHISH